jgi:branched-chain amino acid transport system ATP-binding protein
MIEKNILQIKHVSKSFGGVIAVDDVSFELREGEVLGIIGPNGSGKTTLVNLITSFEKKDAGEVLFKGKDITKCPAHKIADMGLARTFQNMRPYHSMPAYKNLIPALFSPRNRRTAEGNLGDRDAVAIDLLEEVGFDRAANIPYQAASSLPLGYLKRLEIARCLAMNPIAIICDEVFSGLSVAEITSLVPLIERLRKNGITLIMIEHRLRELFQVANRLLVLNFGVKIVEGSPDEVMKRKEVRNAYLGEEVEA